MASKPKQNQAATATPQPQQAKPTSSNTSKHTPTKTIKQKPGKQTTRTIATNTPFFIAGLMIAIASAALYFKYQHKLSAKKTQIVFSASELYQSRFVPVACANKTEYPSDAGLQTCVPAPNKCGRAVIDELVSASEAKQLTQLAETFMSLGGGSGPPTIFDITSGALSKGTKFVDGYRTLNQKDRQVDPNLVTLFLNVTSRIRDAVATQFNATGVVLASPTFFSRVDGSRQAKTAHDEYWHVHVDTIAYPSFCYTGLLYLNEFGRDFDGGRFWFVESDDTSNPETSPFADTMTVEPRPGRILLFSSADENAHRVEKVLSGVRYVVTISFTCKQDLEAKMNEFKSLLPA